MVGLVANHMMQGKIPELWDNQFPLFLWERRIKHTNKQNKDVTWGLNWDDFNYGWPLLDRIQNQKQCGTNSELSFFCLKQVKTPKVCRRNNSIDHKPSKSVLVKWLHMIN